MHVEATVWINFNMSPMQSCDNIFAADTLQPAPTTGWAGQVELQTVEVRLMHERHALEPSEAEERQQERGSTRRRSHSGVDATVGRQTSALRS